MSEFLNIFNNFANYILSYYSACICCGSIYFYPWFKFYFPLFLCMVMYDNEFKTKEIKIQTKDRIGPLQLASHKVQNRHAGEQKPHWNKTKKRHT